MASLSHGRSNDRAFRIWTDMRRRCSNPNRPEFPRYGGRGIKVCDRWSGSHSFPTFIEDMGEPGPQMSIERVDNNGDYSPSNCIWIPRRDQPKNRESNWRVSINGQEMTAHAAAIKLGFVHNSIVQRLKKGGYGKRQAVPMEVLLKGFNPRVIREPS